MSLTADARRIQALAAEVTLAVDHGWHGAAGEWLRLLTVEASKLAVALAGVQTPPVSHVEQEATSCEP